MSGKEGEGHEVIAMDVLGRFRTVLATQASQTQRGTKGVSVYDSFLLLVRCRRIHRL